LRNSGSSESHLFHADLFILIEAIVNI